MLYILHSGGLWGGPKPLIGAAYWRWTILVTFCEADIAEGPPPGHFGLSRFDFLHSSGFLSGLIKMCIMFGIMICRAF